MFSFWFIEWIHKKELHLDSVVAPATIEHFPPILNCCSTRFTWAVFINFHSIFSCFPALVNGTFCAFLSNFESDFLLVLAPANLNLMFRHCLQIKIKCAINSFLFPRARWINLAGKALEQPQVKSFNSSPLSRKGRKNFTRKKIRKILPIT